MEIQILETVSTAIDILALITCLGALICRILIFPPGVICRDPFLATTFPARFNRLLTICIAALTASSGMELTLRTVEMSGEPMGTALSLVGITLFETHYGNVWIVRFVSIGLLWLGWWIGWRRPDSEKIFGLMLAVVAVIAMTRSATGHAAKWGDFTLPELMDWLHLLSVSAWGGCILVMSSGFLSEAARVAGNKKILAELAGRFSTVSGISLGIIVITGAYNTWIEVGSIHAFKESGYGQMLFVKMSVLLVLVALGATNRFFSVPLLRWRAGEPRDGGIMFRVLARRYRQEMSDSDGVRIAGRFVLKVAIEAVLILIVVVCTSVLLHMSPPSHSSPGTNTREIHEYSNK